jgi:PmbA protein
MSVPDITALAADVLALGGDGPELQVTVTHERSLTSRFAGSVATQATAVDTTTVHVLAVVEGQTGGATCTALDREALRDATIRARTAAEVAARTGAGPYPGLPAPGPGPGGQAGLAGVAAADADGTAAAGVAAAAAGAGGAAVDHATAALDASAAGAQLAAAFSVAERRGVEAFGIWTAGDVRRALVSSRGLAVDDRVTDAYMKVVCRDARGRAGFGARAGIGIDGIDGAAIAEDAARRVVEEEPAALEPGHYPVVLDHDAVGTILDMLGMIAFNGLSHAEGQGALVGRLGTAVAAPGITLVDAPADPLTIPRAFDAEGVAKAPLTLIENGVARTVTHDTRSAALAGAQSTGHALAAGGSAWGPAPTNLVLAPGDAPSIEALAAPIERGIYVTRLWYLNPVHERSALVTGVSREGTFLIEDGRITRPLRDVRFTDSLLEILARTEALTAQRRLVSEAEYYGERFATGSVVPALRSTWRISGGA